MDLRLEQASDKDYGVLAELRLDAMRESLIKVGRYDRKRSLERFRDSYSPENTQKILLNSSLAGFYALIEKVDHLHLDHLYVKPVFQSTGIGSAIMEHVIAHSAEVQLPVRLGALRESRSNIFYLRHGFEPVSESEWDIYYVRKV